MYYATIIDHEAADFTEGYAPKTATFETRADAEAWLEEHDLEFEEDWGWTGRYESWVVGAIEER